MEKFVIMRTKEGICPSFLSRGCWSDDISSALILSFQEAEQLTIFYLSSPGQIGFSIKMMEIEIKLKGE